MDSLQELMDRAVKRGSYYLKGDKVVHDLDEKLAECGVLLLIYAKQIKGLDEAALREKLKDIQLYLDDLRQVIFDRKTNRA